MLSIITERSVRLDETYLPAKEAPQQKRAWFP